MNKKEELEKVMRSRVNAIRSALCGINYWLSDPVPLIYPVIDYLKLLCIEQVALRFVLLADKSSIVFEVRENHSSPIFDLEQIIPIPRLENSGGPIYGIAIGCSEFCFARKGSSCPMLAELFDFTCNSHGKVFKQFLNKLNESLDYYLKKKARQDPVRCLLSPQQSSQTEVESLLFPVRREVSSIYASAQSSLEKEELFPNIFAHVLTGTEDEKGQALHLVLSDQQGKLLHEACSDAALNQADAFEALAKYFSKPLSDAYLSLREGVVYKGMVHEKIPDPLRKLLRISPGGEPDRIICMPVHVEGAPWMVISRLYESSDTSAWENNFYFYHDFLHRLGVHIRAGMKHCFLSAVELVLVEALERGESGEMLYEKINSEWARLSRYYPYDRLRLENVHRNDLKKGEQPLLLDNNNRVVVVRRADNPLFNQEFSYDPINPSAILKACHSVVANYNEAVRQGAKRTEINLSHELPSVIDSIRQYAPPRELLKLNYLEMYYRILSRKVTDTWPVDLAQTFTATGLAENTFHMAYPRAKDRNWVPNRTDNELWTDENLWKNSHFWITYDIQAPAWLTPDCICGRHASAMTCYVAFWVYFFLITAQTHSMSHAFPIGVRDEWNGEELGDARALVSLEEIPVKNGWKLLISNRGSRHIKPPDIVRASSVEIVEEHAEHTINGCTITLSGFSFHSDYAGEGRWVAEITGSTEKH